MESRMDKYEMMEQIGRGAFGAAILVHHKSEKKKYVLKKIRLARQTERCRRSAHQEMALIARIKHPYIVEFKEAWVEKGCYVCIVTGYCEGGDMAELMKKTNGTYFPEENLCKWFTQLILAVEYLHSNFVLHRDLKCSNIFLTRDQDVRLGDFGLAKTLKADDLASSVVGTPNYMCPELLADIPYGFKSDIWSLGCCMYEMAALRPAFKAFDMAGLVSKINRSSIGPLPPCYSPALKTLIKGILRKNPEHRPNASEILKHPYLQRYADQYHPSFNLPTPCDSQKSTGESGSSSSSVTSISLPCTERCTQTRIPSFDDKPKQIDLVSKILVVDAQNNHDSVSRIPKPRAFAKSRRDMIPPASPTREVAGTVHPPKNQLPVIESSPGAKPSAKCSPVASKLRTVGVETSEPELDAANEFAGDSKVIQNETSCSPLSSLCFDAPVHENSRTAPPVSIESEGRYSPSSSLSFDEFVIHENLGTGTDLIRGHKRHIEDPVAPAPPVVDDVIHVIRHSSFRVGNERQNEPDSMSELHSAPPTSVAVPQEKEAIDVNSSKQRAEALEGLLELSADLLEQNRLQELAVVLKPFGKDKVSPRETAIWLAKSLKGMMLEDCARGS